VDGVAADKFRNSNAEVIVQYQNFAACYESAVNVDVNGITRQFVQSDDGAFAELENLVKVHASSTQFDLEIECYIAEQVHGDFFGGTATADKFLKPILLHLGRAKGVLYFAKCRFRLVQE